MKEFAFTAVIAALAFMACVWTPQGFSHEDRQVTNTVTLKTQPGAETDRE